jgi:hypothetical protein
MTPGFRFGWRAVVLAVTVTAGLSGRARAGAWTLPRGGWYAEETLSFFSSDRDINAGGESAPKPFHGVYDEIRAKTYVEYGLRDRLTLLTVLPYRRSRYVDDYNDIHNAGFMDATMGLKWRCLPPPWVVAVSVNASFPTGYNAEAPLALGNGRFNPEFRAHVSHAVNDIAFFSLEAAKDRVGIPYLAEGVYFPLSWVFGKCYVSGLQNFPRHPDGEDYAKWNLSLGLTSEGSNAIIRSGRQKSTTLSAGYGRVFSGRNTGHGSDVSVTVALVF